MTMSTKYDESIKQWVVHTNALVLWSVPWNWCWKTFGNPGRIDSRWDYYGQYFYFKHEEDVILYLLKWS